MRLGAAWREEGARGVWFRVLGRAGYRRLQVWSRDIGTLPGARLADGYRIVEIGPDDAALYLRLRPDQGEEIVRRRFAGGARCFAVGWRGELVNCGWSAAGVVDVEFLRCRLTLPEGYVYQFDGYTAVAHRGRGLACARAAAVADAWRTATGARTVCAATLPENNRATAMQRRLGSVPAGIVRRWPWEFGWVEREWPGRRVKRRSGIGAGA